MDYGGVSNAAGRRGVKSRATQKKGRPRDHESTFFAMTQPRHARARARTQQPMWPMAALALSLLLLVLCMDNASAAADSPSIIVYLADDLGMGEVCQQDPDLAYPINPLGPHGGYPQARPRNPRRTLLTPNIARIAREGTRAMFSYSPSSTCTPSRAAIMLSRNAGTVPMRDNLRINGSNLNLNETTFVSVLRDQGGYHTALIGKWGLGSRSGAPWNHGFDLFFGQLETEQAWSWFPYTINYWKRDWFSNVTPCPTTAYRRE